MNWKERRAKRLAELLAKPVPFVASYPPRRFRTYPIGAIPCLGVALR